MTSDPVDIYVGNRLHQRRKQLGLSQEKVAAFLGVTFQQIQKYERGYNRLPASRLYQLTQILHCNANWFYEGYEQHEPVDPKLAEFDKLFMSAETLKLVDIYYRMDKRKRGIVLRLIGELAK